MGGIRLLGECLDSGRVLGGFCQNFRDYQIWAGSGRMIVSAVDLRRYKKHEPRSRQGTVHTCAVEFTHAQQTPSPRSHAQIRRSRTESTPTTIEFRSRSRNGIVLVHARSARAVWRGA